MKKFLFALALCFTALHVSSQIVEKYGEGYVSDNHVMDKIDIKEIGRSIHVATVEEGQLVVRRYYRHKWENFDVTPIKGIFKLKALKLFAYKAVPYVFCYYDDKMSVIRAIEDKWEFVGEESFGEGSVHNPEFSVIGETPYIVYEDKDYEMLRMYSLLNESTWYDFDLMSSIGVKSYKLAANYRGDLYLSVLNNEGISFKEVNQLEEDVNAWKDLTKRLKVDENIPAIDDFEFIQNKAYITFRDEKGPLIMSLEDLAKKWEVVEKCDKPIAIGTRDFNLNISEYFFYTSLNKEGMPQYLKNNKKGVWGELTNLSNKPAKAVASCEYKNIIYVAYVHGTTNKLMVKTIEKGDSNLQNDKK